MSDPLKKTSDSAAKMSRIYDRVLDRIRHQLDEAGYQTWESVQATIRDAIELEMAAEEMTRDEIDLLSAYIERDLKQIGYYAHETGEGIAAWLNFDLNALEQTMVKRLWELADQTRVQHELLREQLSHSETEYLAGEVTVPGRLRCLNCNEEQVLIQSSSLQPCSACGAVIFVRDSLPWPPAQRHEQESE
ncbi:MULTISPECIES: zinc ribbon-containing protein [Nitrincola]|uniref:Metalloendopeptidase n=1 Tax=Nitrincola nitratireducens TaxID=1229521 RepID=W9UQM2_9GAMM|nr:MULTISPECIES: metalloendopeptidase [Nitrincola]EXJ09374.1 hypothetical protein D791_03657 [Nitrincola nitratireducens]